MKRKILLCVLAIVSNYTYCQLNPIINVPSPDIASLGTYGQIPVSLYTGIPNISIPIYNLKVGKYSFPISFSYHLATVKPNSQGGSLGLGWNLLAGGYITRSVRGFYDEKMGTDGIPHGYYAYATRLKNITAERFRIENDSICPPGTIASKRDHDISADEFSFSFFGYSGNFYYNENQGWTVVSDQDIKVEFDEKDGFLNFDQVKKRLKITQWAGVNQHNRFFSKFTLVTPDGCRYEFGGLDAMEFSIPYYSRNNGDLVATSWRLSKITTPDHRSLSFTYDTSAIMCDIHYYPQKKILDNLPCQDVSTKEIGRAGFGGHLLFPTNIKAIVTPNDTLEFVYFKDAGYGDRFPPQALYWDSYTPNREKFFFDYQLSSTFEFGQFLGENIHSVNDVKEKLRNNILHCIRVKNGASNRTFYFEYELNNRRKLTKFTLRKGLPTIDTKFKIPEKDSTMAIPEYKFKYNDDVLMPRDYVMCNTDSWGYYTNGKVELTNKPDYSIVLPHFGGTMAEVLTEITYPTKGSTKFEYENHTYSKQVSSNRLYIEKRSGNSGGLRIAELTNLRKDGTVAQRLKYYYIENIRENVSSGISSYEPQFIESYFANSKKNSGTVTLFSMGGFSNSVTNHNSPSVGYSSVFEETLDASGNSLGYTHYRFSNYDMDKNGNFHLDEKPIQIVNFDGDIYSAPFTSNSEERGKLLSKENFDSKRNITSKIEYSYAPVNNNSMIVANQRCLIICSRPQNDFSWSNLGWLTKIHQYSYLPIEEKKVTYLHGDSIISTKLITYDDYKQVKVTNEFIGCEKSKGKMSEFQYPYDNNSYNWMVDKHIISPVLTKTETINGYSKSKVTSYYSTNNIPYIANSKIIFNGQKSSDEFIVKRTDSYGNPEEVEIKGLSIILLWGNKGQDLIAKIENAHYDTATLYQLGILESSEISLDYLEANRHKLPNAHIYIYKYDKARRLISVSNPNGTTDYYSYDALDRLKEIYYFEVSNGQKRKCIKKKYDYGYKK